MYEYRRMILTVCLGTYRSAGPHVREFVDRAVAVSLRCAKTEEEKRLHRICKTLHMSRGNLPGAVKASIDRLMVLLFGVDGIEWE
jgi:hypothetical protein